MNKPLGLILVAVGMILAVFVALGGNNKPVQAAQTAFSVQYNTSVVRIGQPFVFRARGTSSGFWQLRNIDSGDYTISVSTKKNYVVVSLTVYKVSPDETDEASALISWVDPAGKSVDIPLTIIPKSSPTPSGASVMKVETLNGEKLYRPFSSAVGDWNGKPPLIYIPIGRSK